LFEAEPGAPVDADSLPCGECRTCRLIKSDGHPDVLVLGPGDTLCKPRAGDSSHPAHPASRDIRICQVRGLIDLVSRYPFEARYRLVVIEPAERLAREASHTILKTLEEPPGHTVLALVTTAPEALLETIISRCRRIDVRTVPRDEIEAGLVAEGVAPKVAAQAATASRGRPGRAIAFAASPGLMGDRARLLERCATISAAGVGERFRYADDLADRYRKDRSDIANELDAWEAFWQEQLRAAASDAGEPALRALGALKAVGQCREDLLTNVIPRSAFELMLLSFPRRTLDVTTHAEPTAHA
jgi:DNA polymerase-3 subunit delta'